jgi:DNA-binding NarL/FixJ family response regulator
MSGPLRIVLLEDSATDADLITEELQRAGLDLLTHRVEEKDAFARALRDFAPNVVLSDHSLARFDALAAIEVLQEERPATPLIVVTGAFDEETAVSFLRAGADDYVLKSNLRRLPRAIAAARQIRAPLERLSPRQLEVLRLVAEGKTTSDIARQLGRSMKTVESHRGELMKRLGIHEVAGLVRYAVRVGLVPPDR